MNAIYALRVATKDRPKIFRLVVIFLFLLSLSTLVAGLATDFIKWKTARAKPGLVLLAKSEAKAGR